MTRSEQINELATALAKANSAIRPPERNKTVKVRTKTGGEYEFQYATLDAIIEAVRGPLSANGLWFMQTLEKDEQKFRLETVLLHSSGQFISSQWPLLVENEGNQAFGSSLTFMRRYALQSLLGIAADTDDDANLADGNEAQIKDRAPKKPADDVIAQPKPPKAKALTPTPIATIESPYPEPESDLTPRLITTGADNPDKIDWVAWGVDFIDHIKRAPTSQTADEWVIANATPLAGMRTHAAKVHTRLANALFEIYKEIGTEPPALP